jgi:hypothetical protein
MALHPLKPQTPPRFFEFGIAGFHLFNGVKISPNVLPKHVGTFYVEQIWNVKFTGGIVKVVKQLIHFRGQWIIDKLLNTNISINNAS